MRLIVVDTNVFVGALKSDGGANRRILRLCLEGRLEPLMGEALLAEYEAVLGRRDLFVDCRLEYTERSELLDAFLSVCRWTSIYYLWRPNLRDEADNHVVELAAAGGASVIITHNLRDFVGEQMEFLNIRVMSPSSFLKELELP
jgi:putative PIN family toxin of toxin-antitoxin system